MLTRLIIRRFKRFVEADVELGNPVVFVGPNDAGKTSALQALLLWQLGLRRYLQKRGVSEIPDKRPGITINRKDLTGIPVSTARALWHDLYVLHNWSDGGKKRADKIRIDIIVEGIDAGHTWRCGLEFDYANEESIYVRPLRGEDGESRTLIPELAANVNVALLAPMSGLAANETRLPPGALDVRIGEGRTAEGHSETFAFKWSSRTARMAEPDSPGFPTRSSGCLESGSTRRERLLNAVRLRWHFGRLARCASTSHQQAAGSSRPCFFWPS